jgi:3'(2'), 5'-bisphosphate nucleotidase
MLLQAIKASILAGKAILEVYQTNFDIDFKEDRSPVTLADRRADDIIREAMKVTNLPVLSEEGEMIDHEIRQYWQKYWLVDPLDGTKEFVNRNGEFTVNIALIENNKPVLGIIYAPTIDLLYYSNGTEAFKLEKAELQLIGCYSIQELIQNSTKLPLQEQHKGFTLVLSRSHQHPDTKAFIEKIQRQHGEINFITKGSSLKLCMIAEGVADCYPRFGPTSEWDTAAGHAIVDVSGGKLVLAENPTIGLSYNKISLLNPSFIAHPKSN